MNDESRRYVKIICAALLQSRNIKLSAAGLAFALGAKGLGSMRWYAATEGVSVAAVSKWKRYWEKLVPELFSSLKSSAERAAGPAPTTNPSRPQPRSA